MSAMTALHDLAPGSANQVHPMLPPGDYVSPGLKCILLDSLFPNMRLGDKSNHPWRFLRRAVPHNWYVDRRYPLMGFVSRDEAMLLYNAALQFHNRPALEIGCWMGWSTAHLAAGGVRLDVIDPGLREAHNFDSVTHALQAGESIDKVRLYPIASPAGVDQLAELSKTKWSLFFIDGDHEAPGPVQDAHACLRHAAEDAMVIFHDMASPDVAAGLEVFHRAGWRTLVYQTMQIMGVAWRGSVTPMPHTPDPAVAWELPDHLSQFAVSGSSDAAEVRRLSGHLQWLTDEHTAAVARLHQLDAELDAMRMELAASKETTAAAEEEAGIRHAEAEVARQELGCARLEIARVNARVAHMEGLEQDLECARLEIINLNARLAHTEKLREIAQDQIDRPGLRLAARAIRTRMPHLAARLVGGRS
jgi:predicted O-methyltransferase YrrM